MRLYHFVNRKYGLEDIRRRRLKVATINELNDPFEFFGMATTHPGLANAFAQVKAGLAKNRGLLCFSTNWRNPVQWSHYADCHRGLCLGFEVTVESVPVTYTSRRLNPDVEVLRAYGPAALAHMLKLLTVKFSHWRYEDEHRLFVDLKTRDKKTGLYFFDFSKEVALREVIVGVNSTITSAVLRRALGSQAADVEVYQAALAPRTFRVVRQKFDKA